MKSEEPTPSGPKRWETFRFSVVGGVLASPPTSGELQHAIERLAATTWIHPTTGKPIKLGFSTIERWFYKARGVDDPVGALKRKVRSDCGKLVAMTEPLRHALRLQYRDHPCWTYQLHSENLAAYAVDELKMKPEEMPSYSSVRRFMKEHGMIRRKRRGPTGSPGGAVAELRFLTREVRSYEVTHVNGLWHADFHDGRRKVLIATGQLLTPVLLAVMDDCSRLVCHGQWYLCENSENHAHGLKQALQKRGLCRSYMTDEGGAMTAGEIVGGLERLSIVPTPTLPYSPEQNAKMERFWGQVEGRLIPMLEGIQELTLDLLNQATQAWLELEYWGSQCSPRLCA